VAEVLARRGATVVPACRDVDEAKTIAARIGVSTVSALRLDWPSLASVRQAPEHPRSTYPRLDLLINNAGVMMTPYGRTEDGFEMHLGVNHLGHFAFTGSLLDRRLAASGARVVTVSSPDHREVAGREVERGTK
jgi:NAD(P)-dependent dehydrogenase (short-subunit alcohol dehydrogenase family)